MVLFTTLSAAGCLVVEDNRQTFELDTGVEDVGVPDGEPIEEASCAAIEEDFRPCGGDPVGIWEIEIFCPTPSAFDVLDGTCTELTSDGTGTALGRLIIDAADTYTLRFDERSLDFSFAFPLACYGGSVEPCNGTFFNATCDVVPDEVCACQSVSTLEDILELGTLERNGSTLTMMSDSGTTQNLFCVSRDEQTLDFFRLATGNDIPFRMRLRSAIEER